MPLDEDAYVTEPKYCDFCKLAGERRRATVDGATRLASAGRGQWANMCAEHYAECGVGLGLGRGQRLHVLGEEL